MNCHAVPDVGQWPYTYGDVSHAYGILPLPMQHTANPIQVHAIHWDVRSNVRTVPDVGRATAINLWPVPGFATPPVMGDRASVDQSRSLRCWFPCARSLSSQDIKSHMPPKPRPKRAAHAAPPPDTTARDDIEMLYPAPYNPPAEHTPEFEKWAHEVVRSLLGPSLCSANIRQWDLLLTRKYVLADVMCTVDNVQVRLVTMKALKRWLKQRDLVMPEEEPATASSVSAAGGVTDRKRPRSPPRRAASARNRPSSPAPPPTKRSRPRSPASHASSASHARRDDRDTRHASAEDDDDDDEDMASNAGDMNVTFPPHDAIASDAPIPDTPAQRPRRKGRSARAGQVVNDGLPSTRATPASTKVAKRSAPQKPLRTASPAPHAPGPNAPVDHRAAGPASAARKAVPDGQDAPDGFVKAGDKSLHAYPYYDMVYGAPPGQELKKIKHHTYKGSVSNTCRASYHAAHRMCRCARDRAASHVLSRTGVATCQRPLVLPPVPSAQHVARPVTTTQVRRLIV